MSAETTLTEAARTLQAEYEKVVPFRLALNEKVEDVFEKIKSFLVQDRENARSSNFYWVLRQHKVNITDNDLAAEGIYFENFYPEEEPNYLSFAEMENIDTILAEEREKIIIVKLERERLRKIAEKDQKRTELHAELAKLVELEETMILPKRTKLENELAQLNEK
jgi:hypothetical protein